MTISRFRTTARLAAIGAALTAPRNSGFQFGVDFKIEASGLRQLRTRTEARFAAAARAAVMETARELELRFEAATAAAGLPNLARVWNSKALNLTPGERARGDLAAAYVYPKGGARTKGAIRAHTYGARIRKGNGMLWWPTGYNTPQGRRGGEPRISVQKMARMEGAFVIDAKGGRGAKLWCLPAAEAQRLNISTGRVTRTAYAGNIQVGNSRKRGGIRAKALLDQGFVPMFIGMKEVTLTQRIDLRAAGTGFGGRLRANFIARAATLAGGDAGPASVTDFKLAPTADGNAPAVRQK